MDAPYTVKRLTEVEDSAPGARARRAPGDRFAPGTSRAEHTGVTHHRLTADTRQGFGHRHQKAEEVYVVLAGSGRMKLDELLEGWWVG